MAELLDRFIVGSSGSEATGAFIYCSGGQDVVMPRDKRSCASTGCGHANLNRVLRPQEWRSFYHGVSCLEAKEI